MILAVSLVVMILDKAIKLLICGVIGVCCSLSDHIIYLHT